MRPIRIATLSFAAGVVAATLLDPERGRGRRAQLRQRTDALLRRTAKKSERAIRAAESELHGAAQKLQHLRPEDMHPADDRLLDRVRSELFRDPTIPKGQINLSVEDGTLVLRGHVDTDSLKQTVETRARTIAGVEEVDNRLNITAG